MSSPPASFAGIPLSLISLVTLTVQNSALTIVLHYSRISVPADKMYSAASAVLLNELLKGAISLSIAFRNAVHAAAQAAGSSALERGEYAQLERNESHGKRRAGGLGPAGESLWSVQSVERGGRKMLREVFSSDCWKLSIPACLYVIQNNLQFVAASNLDVPTFQVTYNLKILTTALFSVFLLRRRLSLQKWGALLFLAAGVGVVQLQSSTASGSSSSSHGGVEMDKAKGLLAVFCACMTSGLAGVYFEMVLKGSKADLWIRNVQLSFFSLLPAAFAVFAPGFSLTGERVKPSPTAGQPVFANFGGWAWSVVLIQVFGGLVTALVIRYSDNIMKGFATSLAIVLSFIAGIILFNFQVTLSFLVGTAMVVTSTYLYNTPDAVRRGPSTTLPSPSLSKGAFIAPAPSYPDPSPSYSSHSALHSVRSASSSSTSPSLSLSGAGGASTPAYGRRPHPQSIPPGAQTPDHSVHFFPSEGGAQQHHQQQQQHVFAPVATAPVPITAAGGIVLDNPYPIPYGSPKQQGGFPPGGAASTLSPDRNVNGSAEMSRRASGDSYSSGRNQGGMPGSPEPGKRRTSGVQHRSAGSESEPRWS
ncbi:hypothetical protein JCM8547_002899 [Rhodosporidiobolus lusitaniae]